MVVPASSMSSAGRGTDLDVAAERDIRGAVTRFQVAFEFDGAAASERAGTADAAEEDRAAAEDGADVAVVDDVVVERDGARACGDDIDRSPPLLTSP